MDSDPSSLAENTMGTEVFLRDEVCDEGRADRGPPR
jgi:hypothetical protein